MNNSIESVFKISLDGSCKKNDKRTRKHTRAFVELKKHTESSRIFEGSIVFGRPLPINSLLILSALQSQRRLTIAEIAEVTNLGEIRAKAVVEKVVRSSWVLRIHYVQNINSRRRYVNCKCNKK